LKDKVIQRDEDLNKVERSIATVLEGDYDVLDALERTNNY
jgi:hypothetical protein